MMTETLKVLLEKFYLSQKGVQNDKVSQVALVVKNSSAKIIDTELNSAQSYSLLFNEVMGFHRYYVGYWMLRKAY